MSATVFFAVLAAAAMHAGWNAMVKVDLDRLRAMILLGLAMAGMGLIMVLISPMAAAASFPYVAASALLHAGYNIFLVRAYRAGDLGQVYPLARGTAPLISTAGVFLITGEKLSIGALGGVALVIFGIGLMALFGGRKRARLEPQAIGFALTTSLFIGAYTITDGLGVRASLSAPSYTGLVFIFDSVVMTIIGLSWRGRALFADMQGQLVKAGAAGALSFGSYLIALWAMTLAPIGAVAALRETSILFAVLISTFILREPMNAARASACVLILAGAIALRFA